jgi:hypothetical protein
MIKDETVFHLLPEQFSHTERIILENSHLSASVFRFQSGVCGLRLKNDLGEVELLPYQGQQIWSASLLGRTLTMKSMFDQPYPTRDFLATFGGFLQHCGATAMGVPGPEDTHPVHGELPNAPYQEAHLICGEDEFGAYIGLGGTYQHTVAFNYNYLAQPLVKLYSGSSVFHVSMKVTNLKKTPMPILYLAHINFRPVDDGRLVYSAHSTTQHMRVRADLPPFMETAPGYREFIEELRTHPEKHQVLKKDLPFNPEVVLFIDCLGDSEGWARSLQIHPDGSADVVRHHISELNHYTRWINRMPDQDAVGFEPGSAGPTGFSSEKRKGNVRVLPGGGVFMGKMQIGVLTTQEAQAEEILVEKILQN